MHRPAREQRGDGANPKKKGQKDGKFRRQLIQGVVISVSMMRTFLVHLNQAHFLSLYLVGGSIADAGAIMAFAPQLSERVCTLPMEGEIRPAVGSIALDANVWETDLRWPGGRWVWAD